jgi:membrane protein required for colicin V production
MEVYDVIMLVILLGATLFGAWKGLAWQVASLGAIVASYLVALKYRDEVAEHISANPPWNVFLAMLVLYVGTSLAIWIGFRLVSNFIDRLKLKEFDRQIGALFGLAKGVLLCVIVTLFAVSLSGETQRQAIVQSRSGYYIARLLDKAHTLMPEEMHDVLHPYIHPLGRQLPTSDPHYRAYEPPADGSVLQAWDDPTQSPLGSRRR